MVKRQAMTASLGGSAPNSLMAGPWNMSQQLALQGALAAGGIAGGIGGGQPLQLANSLAREELFYGKMFVLFAKTVNMAKKYG